MQSLSTVNTNYSLEVSLEDLHRESRTWLSKIAFWKNELTFYQRLLEVISVKLTSIDDKKQIDHFQNLIIYFQGELLDQFRHDIRQHEKYLVNLMLDKAPFNEQYYREVHKRYEDQINSFELDFRQYKADLYHFAGRFL